MESAVAEKIKTLYKKQRKQKFMSLSPPQTEFPSLKMRKSKRIQEIDVQKWIKKRKGQRKNSDNESVIGHDESSVEELQTWRSRSKESLHSKASVNGSKEFKTGKKAKIEIESFNMEIKTYLNCTHQKIMIGDLGKMKNGDEEYLKSLNSRRRNKREILSPGLYRPSKLMKLEKKQYSKDNLTQGSPTVSTPVRSPKVIRKKEVILKKTANIKKYFITKRMQQQKQKFMRRMRSPISPTIRQGKSNKYALEKSEFARNLNLKKVKHASNNLKEFYVDSFNKDFKGKLKSPKRKNDRIADKRMKTYLKSILPDFPSNKDIDRAERPKIVVEEN